MAQIFATDRAQAQTAAPKRAATTTQDNRLATFQAQADTSAATGRLAQLQARQGADTVQRLEEEEALQGKFAEPIQRMEEEELQGKFIEPVQRMEEEELQGKFIEPVQRMEEEELQGKFIEPVQRKETGGGLPADLRAGVEQLSGADMSGVQVHYNSPAPAQMQAHAFAQGTDIHVAPGQERHLPHEAWHVAQQAQGRVQPTVEVGGVAVNDNPGLEQEADNMGAQAAKVGTAAHQQKEM